MRQTPTAAPTLRVTAMAIVGALVMTGCGSRLSESEIAHYASGGLGGGQAPAVAAPGGDGGTAAHQAGGAGTGRDQGGEPPETEPASSPPEGNQPSAPGVGGGQAGAVADAPSPPPTSADGSGPGPPEEHSGDGGGSSEGDTRAAPPGGNGGATDVGVTADTITIFNVADLSGAIPGLFRDTYEATLAYVQYFTATEGTVYGRTIELVSRDTQLSTQGNRAAYLDACTQAFAAVGSTSAFEEGAAEPIQSCRLPDLRTTPTSEALQSLPTSLGMLALRPGDFSLAEYEYYKERFPEAITNAGYVWLENQTTNYQVQNYMTGTEPIGYQWKAKIALALAETNYARAVTQLKNDGIEIVFFLGNYQHAARLAQAMQQQSYAPVALALQSNMYTQDLITSCEGACDDFAMVAQNGALTEEIASNPELQLYAEWLARINPRARPTGLGMYAWSAAKLFIETLKKVGPDLTRQALLDELEAVDGYTANGLIPPQHVGTQEVSGCVVMLDIEGGAFTRVAPAEGYRCQPGRAPGF